VKSWAETTYDGRKASEVSGAKVTLSDIVYAYTGALTGEGSLKYLMHYREDGTVQFTGMEAVTGSIDGRTGSFTFLHTGVVDETGAVVSTIDVVPGSGQGGLAGLSGRATVYITGHQESYPMVFSYSFAGA
jgi:hypothetical protein